MTRAQIAAKISEATGLSKKETEIVVEGFISCVIESLRNNESIEIRGFGTFKNNIKEPREARNPKTGEKVSLSKRFVPYFKVSRKFRRKIKKGNINALR
jgi:nucleoid DNA-binding protein